MWGLAKVNRKLFKMSQIPFICKKLYEKNLIAGSDGNVSERSGDNFLITPSLVDKSQIREEDLCLIDSRGNSLKGKKASSEKYMHLFIYENQKRAQAVIHAHPPFAIALSLARPKWKFLPRALPEIVLSLGSVPFVPYSCPGTKKLAEALGDFIQESQALILSHHGAIVWAEDLEKAVLMMEQLEHSCKIICASESMGKTKSLSKKALKELLNRFSS